MSLTEEQKKLLGSTGSVLNEHGKEIMTRFYATLFKDHPEFRNFFNPTNLTTGKQPEAFAQTIFYFIQHLDNLDVMKPQMSRLSSKHRAVGVKPDQYPTVGKYLIQSIKESLGSKATPEVVAAWQALYSVMSSTFIKREKELYEQLGSDEADKGFVPFTIVKKETIASGPTYALTLARQGGGKLWNYTPGQYITLRIEKDGVLHNGHYTLLEPFNGNTYSVGFKQGNNTDQNTITTEEIVKNRAVGSTVLVSGPAGSFGLVNDAKHHLFISGGIGITSLIPMINELNQQGKASSVTVIQCVRTEGHAAFADKLNNILPKGQYLILTEKDPISKNHLQGKLQPGTHVYISGSETFLGMVHNALAGSGLPKSQIHIKSIEPTLGLLKAIDEK
jgi:nitric oxide dioxygenase